MKLTVTDILLIHLIKILIRHRTEGLKPLDEIEMEAYQYIDNITTSKPRIA